MSRAVVFEAYGGPEVLHVAEVAEPTPSAGQMRVRVRAAGVQPFDAMFRGGRMRQWLPAAFPQRLGNEFAGVVEAVGPEVAGFAPGDEVLGWSRGDSYADHVVVGADSVVPKPDGMPWVEAGALPASGQTAATALARLGVGEGDVLLVHAAAGGVGAFAVQIARAMGATVFGTASDRNHDFLRSLGAVPVRYGDGLAGRLRAAAPDGIGAALDAAGTLEALQASVEVVADPNRRVTVAYNAAADRLGVRRIGTERSTERLSTLTALYRKGLLRIFVQESYPLERADAAHRAIETGHVRGKVVLSTSTDEPSRA